MGLAIFTVVAILVIAYIILRQYAEPTQKQPKPRPQPSVSSKADTAFDFESPRLIQIIQESIEIINKTKNQGTAMRRFDDIKRTSQRLFEILPVGRSMKYEINGREITRAADLNIIDEEKAKWMKEHQGGKGDQGMKEMAISQWAKIFDRALEDGRVSPEEMLELQSLQDQLGLTDADTKDYWSKVDPDKMPTRELVSAEKAAKALETPPPEPWVLTACFGSSRSKIFPQVLSSVQIHPSFRQYKGPNNEDIYEVAFLPEDILNFEQLWSRIKEWKSTIIKIRGEMIDRNTISKWRVFYRDKLKEIKTNPLFCFGASPFTQNLFGCHRSMIRDGTGAMGVCWYHMGKFDPRGVFHVDREAITAKVRQEIYSYRICPSLDVEKVKRGLMLLPDTITPGKDEGWAIEKYYTGIPRLVPPVQYRVLTDSPFTVSSGEFKIDMRVVARITDYSSTVSPQFRFILDQEAKAQGKK